MKLYSGLPFPVWAIILQAEAGLMLAMWRLVIWSEQITKLPRESMEEDGHVWRTLHPAPTQVSIWLTHWRGLFLTTIHNTALKDQLRLEACVSGG